MSDEDRDGLGLKNPMRFSNRPRTVSVDEYLRGPEFDNRHVTDIEITPGQVYIHWDYDD